jgi:hypothetical protein
MRLLLSKNVKEMFKKDKSSFCNRIFAYSVLMKDTRKVHRETQKLKETEELKGRSFSSNVIISGIFSVYLPFMLGACTLVPPDDDISGHEIRNHGRLNPVSSKIMEDNDSFKKNASENVESTDPADISKTIANKKLTDEQAKGVLSEIGSYMVYGDGLGKTALNAGAIYLFPPYGLYVLGNAVLSFTGHEPLSASKLIPEDQRGKAEKLYNNLTSAPGRVTAAIAGKEYRTGESFKLRVDEIVNENPNNDKLSSNSPVSLDNNVTLTQ